MSIELKENERIDDLEFHNLKIIQNEKGFCFGMDSVLLSDFAKQIKKGAKVIDLGTGTGILPLLLSAKTPASKIIGVEIQPSVAEMATRSISLNDLQNKIEIINEDIKNLKEQFLSNSFDVVVTNPPYKRLGTGGKNEAETKMISRHEITANLEDFIEMASYLLKDNASFYMVHRPERLIDISIALRKYHLEPKEMKLIYPYVDKAPNLILIKAVKNAKPFLKILEPLYIYQKDGNYTNEVLKIYHKIWYFLEKYRT